jgi:hypothetical protein
MRLIQKPWIPCLDHNDEEWCCSDCFEFKNCIASVRPEYSHNYEKDIQKERKLCK